MPSNPIAQLVSAIANVYVTEPSVRRLATAVALALGLSGGAYFGGDHGGGHKPEPAPAPIHKRESEEQFAPRVLEAEFVNPPAAKAAHLTQGAEK